MNEIMQNPEFLTYVSYVVLGGLTIWVIAHGMKIFDSLWQDGPKEWEEKADYVSRELEDDRLELQKLQKCLQEVEKEIGWKRDLKSRASQALKVAEVILGKKKNDKGAIEVLLSRYPGCEKEAQALVSEIQSAESNEDARDLVLLKAADCTFSPEAIEEALDKTAARKQKKKRDMIGLKHPI